MESERESLHADIERIKEALGTQDIDIHVASEEEDEDESDEKSGLIIDTGSTGSRSNAPTPSFIADTQQLSSGVDPVGSVIETVELVEDQHIEQLLENALTLNLQDLPASPEICLALNKVYQEYLGVNLRRIEMALAHNREKQLKLSAEIESEQKNKLASTSVKRKPLSLYGIPYFRDINGMCPPLNEDAKQKKELCPISSQVTLAKTWSKSALKTLQEAVKADCLRIKMRSTMNKKEIELTKLKELLEEKQMHDSKLELLQKELEGKEEELKKKNKKNSSTKNKEEIFDKILKLQNDFKIKRQAIIDAIKPFQEAQETLEAKITNLSQELKSIKNLPIQQLLPKPGEGDEEIDWMKISALNFDGHHDPSNCRVMWHNLVHPEIRKSKWTAEEDANLKNLVAKYNGYHWKKVAEELNTGRSAFQCLQRYKTRLISFVGLGKWTPREDALLLQTVDKVTVGGFIPWAKVEMCMEGRSEEECVRRWDILQTTGSRSRWTEQEDKLLLHIVQKYSTTNWEAISIHIPNRTSVQCRERYVNSVDPRLNFGNWTPVEDKMLLEAIKEHNSSWVKVARAMPGRTDNMCLQRYKRLKKWTEQGIRTEHHSKKLEGKRKRKTTDTSSDSVSDESDEDPVIKEENTVTETSKYPTQLYSDALKYLRKCSQKFTQSRIYTREDFIAEINDRKEFAVPLPLPTKSTFKVTHRKHCAIERRKKWQQECNIRLSSSNLEAKQSLSSVEDKLPVRYKKALEKAPSDADYKQITTFVHARQMKKRKKKKKSLQETAAHNKLNWELCQLLRGRHTSRRLGRPKRFTGNRWKSGIGQEYDPEETEFKMRNLLLTALIVDIEGAAENMKKQRELQSQLEQSFCTLEPTDKEEAPRPSKRPRRSCRMVKQENPAPPPLPTAEELRASELKKTMDYVEAHIGKIAQFGQRDAQHGEDYPLFLPQAYRIPPLPPTVTSLHSFTLLLLTRKQLQTLCSRDIKKIAEHMKRQKNFARQKAEYLKQQEFFKKINFCNIGEPATLSYAPTISSPISVASPTHVQVKTSVNTPTVVKAVVTSVNSMSMSDNSFTVRSPTNVSCIGVHPGLTSYVNTVNTCSSITSVTTISSLSSNQSTVTSVSGTTKLSTMSSTLQVGKMSKIEAGSGGNKTTSTAIQSTAEKSGNTTKKNSANVLAPQDTSVVIVIEEKLAEEKKKPKPKEKPPKAAKQKKPYKVAGIKTTEYELCGGNSKRTVSEQKNEFEFCFKSEFEFKEKSKFSQDLNSPGDQNKDNVMKMNVNKEKSRQETTESINEPIQSINDTLTENEKVVPFGLNSPSAIPMETLTEVSTKSTDSINLVENMQPIQIVRSPKPVPVTLNETELKLHDQLVELRGTHEYKLLKERMFSLFLWPALLSTIPVQTTVQNEVQQDKDIVSVGEQQDVSRGQLTQKKKKKIPMTGGSISRKYKVKPREEKEKFRNALAQRKSKKKKTVKVETADDTLQPQAPSSSRRRKRRDNYVIDPKNIEKPMKLIQNQLEVDESLHMDDQITPKVEPDMVINMVLMEQDGDNFIIK